MRAYETILAIAIKYIKRRNSIWKICS